MRTDAKSGVGPKPDEGWTLIVVSPGASHVTESTNAFPPDEFNWFSHFLVPLAATAALAYLLYKSFSPFPASPYKYSPLIVGLWIIGGVVILAITRARGREGWLMKAGEAVADIEEEADREALPVPGV